MCVFQFFNSKGKKPTTKKKLYEKQKNKKYYRGEVRLFLLKVGQECEYLIYYNIWEMESAWVSCKDCS